MAKKIKRQPLMLTELCPLIVTTQGRVNQILLYVESKNEKVVNRRITKSQVPLFVYVDRSTDTLVPPGYPDSDRYELDFNDDRKFINKQELVDEGLKRWQVLSYIMISPLTKKSQDQVDLLKEVLGWLPPLATEIRAKLETVIQYLEGDGI